MSTNNGVIPIEEITLNNTKFGEQLNERLNKIHQNFTKIVESEYLKGAPGNNTVTKSVTLTKSNDSTGVYLNINSENELTLGDLFKYIEDAIKSKWGIESQNDQSLEGIGESTWNQDLSGKEIILITEQISDRLILKSVIPIVHIDLRFYNKNISEDPSKYTNLIDTSCSIHYDTEKGFEALSTFPTLYYDSQVGEGNLCWKINGQETGMPAQGPTGKDADPYISYLCKGEMVDKKNIKIIEKWDLNNEGTYEWISINGQNNLPEKTQCFVLVQQENDSKGSYRYDLYIIYPTWDTTLEYFKGTNNIGVQNNWSDTQFKQCMLNLGSSGAAAGLLIPTNEGQQHHIFKKGENNKLLLEYSGGTNTFEINEFVDIKKNTNITGALNIKGKPEDLTIEDDKGKKRSLKDIIISESKLYEEITYENLVKKKNNSELDPGRNYIITDYSPKLSTSKESKHNLDRLADNNDNKKGFNIVVRAISSDKLSEEAHVSHRRGDTYFANCNLSAWQIMYCLENDTKRFSWANTSEGKGVIYLMKDEFGNIAPFDFKQIRFVDGMNKFLFDNNGEDASISNNTDICMGNIISDYYVDGKLTIPFIIIGKRSNNNIINNSNNVKLGVNCNGNVISSSKEITLEKVDIVGGNISCENNMITGSTSISMVAGTGNKIDNCESIELLAACMKNIINNCGTINLQRSCMNNNLNACACMDLGANSINNMIYYNNGTSESIIKITKKNTFIFNGNILANNIYQSNQ